MMLLAMVTQCHAHVSIVSHLLEDFIIKVMWYMHQLTQLIISHSLYIIDCNQSVLRGSFLNSLWWSMSVTMLPLLSYCIQKYEIRRKDRQAFDTRIMMNWWLDVLSGWVWLVPTCSRLPLPVSPCIWCSTIRFTTCIISVVSFSFFLLIIRIQNWEASAIIDIHKVRICRCWWFTSHSQAMEFY